MRVTTNSMMRTYNSRLNNVLQNLSVANEKVITQRKFLKASENPSEAVKSYRLRREMSKTEDYLSNLNTIESSYDNIETSMMKISNYGDDVYVKVLEGKNGTLDADQRQIIATEIRTIQKAAVMELNARFEGKYLFGGSSTKELPFELDETTNQLYYRGYDVNTGLLKGTPPGTPPDLTKLEELQNEKIFVDLGFGMKVDPTQANPGNMVQPESAYNVAMPGIKFIGIGEDQNLIVTMGKIAEALEAPNFTSESLNGLADQLEAERTTMLINVTQMGSNTMFIEHTKTRLEEAEFSLNKKIVNTEQIDLDKAITEFKMQEYVYQAALKMGMKILTPSFIDFMN